MPRTIPGVFFGQFIHRADALLKKFERWIGSRAFSKKERPGDLKMRVVNRPPDLVNLPAVAEQVVTRYEPDAHGRSVDVFVDVAPDALVIGDWSDLHWLIEQLIISGLEATPDSGWMTISGAAADGVVTLVFCSCSREALPEELCEVPRGNYTVPPIRLSSDLGFWSSPVHEILRAHGGLMEVSKRSRHKSRVAVRLPVTAHRSARTE